MRQLTTAWDRATLCRTGIRGTCLRNSRMKLWRTLEFAWFPDQDIVRLVPELTDFPFGPENVICVSKALGLFWSRILQN